MRGVAVDSRHGGHPWRGRQWLASGLGDADVRLTVRNDLPPGADTRQAADVSTVNGGYGLTGMHERLRLLNGTLEAGRRDGQWIVTAKLPRCQPETMAS